MRKEMAAYWLSTSLDDKIDQTCVNISDWDIFTDGRWYISFSGGKDSTVLLHIAARMLNGLENPHPLRVLFCDTGLEYPEIRRFVPWYIDWLREKFPRVPVEYTRARPKKRFWDVVRDYGYPVISKYVAKKLKEGRNGGKTALKSLNGEVEKKSDGRKSIFDISAYKYLLEAPFLISDVCCKYSKKEPAKTYERETKYYPVIASMACESMLRRQAWLKNGCNAYEGKRPHSNPMSFWTEQDVLHYILQEDIPICSVYGEIRPFDGRNFYDSSLTEQPLKCTGCQRTGCVFCAFGAHLDKKVENNFQRLKRTHPKHWNYCINGGEWDPVDGMWKPSRTPGHVGLGMGRVLDFIGVPYE